MPFKSDQETKYVRSDLNFNLDKGVDKKPDQVASEVAARWIRTNPDWTFTGNWRNQRAYRGTREISLFEVRRPLPIPG